MRKARVAPEKKESPAFLPFSFIQDILKEGRSYELRIIQ